MPGSWQEINEEWLYRHWWQDLRGRKIYAMITLLLLLGLLVLGVLAGTGRVHDSRDPDYSLRLTNPEPRVG